MGISRKTPKTDETAVVVAEPKPDFIAAVLDEGEVVKDGVTVLTNPRTRHATFEGAVVSLVKHVADGENSKVAAARDLQDIRDLELYKEAGLPTFKDALPVIIAQTERVGWKSGTSVKRYLAWADLYLDLLQLPEKTALGAVSHYHILYRLADVDRNTGELREEPKKEGKLGSVEFDDVARLVGWLVTEPSRKEMETGLTAEQTVKRLSKAGLGKAAETYAKLMGRVVTLPAGGWGVANTQEIVDKVTGKTEEEKAKVVVKLICEHTIDGYVFVKERQFFIGEELKETWDVEKTYNEEQFKLFAGSDKVVFEGEAEEDEEE